MPSMSQALTARLTQLKSKLSKLSAKSKDHESSKLNVNLEIYSTSSLFYSAFFVFPTGMMIGNVMDAIWYYRYSYIANTYSDEFIHHARNLFRETFYPFVSMALPLLFTLFFTAHELLNFKNHFEDKAASSLAYQALALSALSKFAFPVVSSLIMMPLLNIWPVFVMFAPLIGAATSYVLSFPAVYSMKAAETIEKKAVENQIHDIERALQAQNPAYDPRFDAEKEAPAAEDGTPSQPYASPALV